MIMSKSYWFGYKCFKFGILAEKVASFCELQMLIFEKSNELRSRRLKFRLNWEQSWNFSIANACDGSEETL